MNKNKGMVVSRRHRAVWNGNYTNAFSQEDEIERKKQAYYRRLERNKPLHNCRIKW